MKTKMLKPLAIVLSAALLVGAGVAVYATGAANSQPAQETETTASADTTATATNQKDETVYVLAGADGSVKKIIVSDWIKNALGSATLEDSSVLTDVENVKGSESYTMNGDNMRVWDAQGKDIYCQGTVQKELPVTLSVSYKLDGKAISAEELAGKSGKVTIRYDYRNNQYQTVTIDGKQETIYVPFAMLTGMLLDSDTFTNVEVSNGKLLNDGSHTAVVGIAFPGLQENLRISADKLEIPSYVEITADVQNFAMTNTVTIATNELFNQVDADKLDSTEKLTASLKELTDAMDQLMNGSSALYNGLCTLLEKSGTLISGIDQLATGTAKLKDGAGQVDSGTAALLAGLTTLSENNDKLNAGAATVFDTLLRSVESQLAQNGLTVETLTIDNYTTVLTALLQSPDAQQSAVLEAMAKTVLEQKLADANVPQGYYEPVKLLLAQRLAAGQTTEHAMQEIGAILYKAQLGDETSAKVLENAVADVATPTGQATVKALYLSLARQTLQPQITEAIAGLDSYHEFYTGVQEYTAGVSSAKDGAATLKAGTAELSKGAAELYDGVLQLKDGAPALTQGVTQLRDGAMQLSGGLKEFNEKGVQKLVDAVNGDLGGLVTRIKATVEVSKSYQSFSGLSDSMDGQVKFIYRTDAIGE